jgi:plasmid stability protein
MASLLVRQLDDDLVRRLKERAAAHGRSAEAEHRAILEEALRPKLSGVEFWARLRGSGEFLTDEELAEMEAGEQPVPEPPDFSR